jgi:hypothetical protein
MTERFVMSRSRIARYSLAIAGATLAIVTSVLLGLHNSAGKQTAASKGAMAWYTVDDGKTWFADALGRLTPFDHDGRPACRCYLYCCDGGATKFVGYLERYTPESKQKLEDLINANKAPEPDAIEELMKYGVEVAQPGSRTWIKAIDPRAQSIRMPKCPDGSRKQPVPILPPM